MNSILWQSIRLESVSAGGGAGNAGKRHNRGDTLAKGGTKLGTGERREVSEVQWTLRGAPAAKLSMGFAEQGRRALSDGGGVPAGAAGFERKADACVAHLALEGVGGGAHEAVAGALNW